MMPKIMKTTSSKIRFYWIIMYYAVYCNQEPVHFFGSGLLKVFVKIPIWNNNVIHKEKYRIREHSPLITIKSSWNYVSIVKWVLLDMKIPKVLNTQRERERERATYCMKIISFAYSNYWVRNGYGSLKKCRLVASSWTKIIYIATGRVTYMLAAILEQRFVMSLMQGLLG